MKSKWGYSRTVTVGNFLTNLFRNPEITLSPDCPPTEDENPTFESLPKARKGLLKDDSPPSSKIKRTYDDWDSADEDEDVVEPTNQVPTPQSISDYIL